MFNKVDQISFKVNTGFPITQAVLDGRQQGDLYESGANLFVQHKSGFSSLIQSTNCIKELIELCREDQIPQYFHLYDASKDLISAFEQHHLFNTRLRKRIQLKYLQKDKLSLEVPDGFYLQKINECNFEALENLGLALDNRFWKNKDNVINEAKGVIAFNNDQNPVSICYAAAIGDNKAEVDVMTQEQYRGKGLAKLVVSGFINSCLADNIIPHWDCFADNISSINTANALNFQEYHTYDFLSIFKHKT